MDTGKILNSFFLTNSLNVLTEEISEAVARPIIVTDSTFHIVSAFSSFEYKNTAFKKAVMHSELSMEVCAEITKHSKEGEGPHFRIETKDCSICAGILLNAGVFIGYILYFLDEAGENFCSENDLMICESLLRSNYILKNTVMAALTAQLKKFWKTCLRISMIMKSCLTLRFPAHICRIINRSTLRS